MTVFHWHGDTFDLPSNSIRMAHSKNYQTTLNSLNKTNCVIGIQESPLVFEQKLSTLLNNPSLKLVNQNVSRDGYVDELLKDQNTKVNSLKNLIFGLLLTVLPPTGGEFH